MIWYAVTNCVLLRAVEARPLCSESDQRSKQRPPGQEKHSFWQDDVHINKSKLTSSNRQIKSEIITFLERKTSSKKTNDCRMGWPKTVKTGDESVFTA